MRHHHFPWHDGARVATLALATLTVGVGTARSQQTVARGAAVDPHASFRIYNLVGTTRVIGWDRDSIDVRGTVPDAPHAFFFGATPMAGKFGVDMPGNAADATPAHIEVRVPVGSRVWIKSVTANVDVHGVHGGLDVYTVSGTVLIADAGIGEMNVESMDGSVTAAATPWTRVKTASGAIAVSGGDDVGLSTVSGAVRYVGEGFHRLALESVTGDLAINAAPAMGARLEVENHGGRTTLTLPKDLSVTFDVSDYQGSIENGLTATVPSPLQDGMGSGLQFTLGTGRTVVIVHSFKGDVVLKPR